MIEVTNLSSITETESFRVDGLGNAKLLVVRCTLDQYPEIQKSSPMRDLKSQLSELKAEKNAREKEVAILRAYGKSMAEKTDLTPGQAEAFSDTLFDKTLACAETVRDLNERITRLNQKIHKMQTSRTGAAFTKAVITILADEDGPAHLRLVYREGNFSKKRTLLIRYAQVCRAVIGTLCMTYMLLLRTGRHRHRSLFTTVSICHRIRGRIGLVRS